MRTKGSFAALIFFIILIIGVAIAIVMYRGGSKPGGIWIGIIAFVIAIIVSASIKIADQWERAMVLRLGRFHALRGPGLFFIIPVIDNIPYWIDIRVITTSFTAEKTLTKDTVPVDVDAVLFWKVVNPQEGSPRCRRL
jgi:regulator of protease activity HflC (stomatin/prohibitin superfamily)